MLTPHQSILTVEMLSLMTNQQCQSTEGRHNSETAVFVHVPFPHGWHSLRSPGRATSQPQWSARYRDHTWRRASRLPADVH